MKILTAAEMGTTDRRTAEEFAVPLNVLMENAGTAVAKFCLAQYPNAEHVVVLCGKGNNGGDGFVAARHIAREGRRVTIALLGLASEVKAGEAAEALARLRAETPHTELHEISDARELASLLAH